MSKKTTILMRVLALSNVLEGAIGLFSLVLGIFTAFDPMARLILTNFPKSPLPYYVVFTLDLAFIVSLFISASMLWRLRRTGLVVLGWALASEVIFLFVVMMIHTFLWSRADAQSHLLAQYTQDILLLAGSTLWIQILTAYPLVAGVLIYITLRSLRITAGG